MRRVFAFCAIAHVYSLTGCTGAIGDTGPTPPAPPLPLVVRSSPARVLSNDAYRKSINALLGQNVPESLFTAWPATPQFSGFDGIIWTGFSGEDVQVRVATVEKLLDTIVASPRVMICEPGIMSSDECARQIIASFAIRAFRRLLTNDELTQLMDTYHKGYTLSASQMPSARDQYYEGLRMALGSVLISPSFMVRTEAETNTGERDLDPFEIATRLSFLMTGEPPDDTTWGLALTGALKDVDVVRSEALRLLSTRTDAFVESFFGELFDFRTFESFPDGSLERSFARESALVMQEVLERNLPVSSILQPGFTYVNAAVAGVYALPNVDARMLGADFLRVETNERGGILEQGSVLTVTAAPARTSPTRRGRWVQGRLLCKMIPPPDASLFAEIAAVSASIPADATVKERVDAHRAHGAACMGCHGYMDPIGLGLEGFDQHGKKRDFYPDGRPVETDSDLMGKPFKNVTELNAVIDGMSDFGSCMAEKLVVYGLGRMTTGDDDGLIGMMSASVDGKEPTFEDMVVRLVTSTPFLRTSAPR